VLPYLAASLRARAGTPQQTPAEQDSIRNPVFSQMEIRLAWRDD